MSEVTITELMGDGIGPELAASVHRVADALPVNITWEQIDWSLETREANTEAAIDAAEDSMRRTKVGLKYPTVTQTSSPNALIRRRLNFSVIYRPAISIPGIESNFTKDVNLHIVRIATGGTYDDPGKRTGKGSATSQRIVESVPCRYAAKFAFEMAKREGWPVCSASKYTIQRATDGLFEEIANDVAKDYPDVTHQVELFDAVLAKIILNPDNFRVVLTLNEYGDFLSDMASGLVGSMGTGASGNFSFNQDGSIDIAMFDPAGGTAPDIAGKGICNPTAVLLAFGMLLDHIGHHECGKALRLALLGAIRDGESTGDLGGSLNTEGFTNVVVERIQGLLK